MTPALNLPAPRNESNGLPSKKGVQIENVDELSEQSSNPSRFSTGGIIFPPPELRNIVDKTAQYVARNGIEFESKIRGDNSGGGNNNRLAFLYKDDPYNTYYQAKLEALRNGTGPLFGINTQSEQQSDDQKVHTNQQIEDEKPPIEPEQFRFIADMPNITALDLDIVKLTALFVAKRGRSFISDLQSKEGISYQFEFLRPSHSLFGFFNRLVEQYQIVMESSPEMQRKIKLASFGVENPIEGAKPITGMGRGRQEVLKDIQTRSEFEKWEKARRKKEEDEEAKERVAFDEIDWQDFVVAGSVELTDADEHIDLPPPMSLREVRNMSMAQKQMAAMIMENEDEEEEEDVVDMNEPTTSSANLPIKIRKDYQPKSLAERKAASATTEMTTCPVCKERVPINQMDEHVRVELLDPKFREQRRELENKRSQHNALLEGANPSRALKQFAGNRTDIFGGEMEEEAQRKREQEESRKRKERETIVWDGHAASKVDTRAEFNKPDAIQSEMQQIQKRFKTDQQKTFLGPNVSNVQFASPVHMQVSSSIQQQPSTIPFAPASMMQNLSSNQYYSNPSQQQGYPQQQQMILEKRSDGILHSESDWIQSHPHPIKIVIQMPDGVQTVFQNLPIQTTIGNIRDKIQSETLEGKIGASRLKLKVDGSKSTTLRQSLAHWNLQDGDLLTLQIG